MDDSGLVTVRWDEPGSLDHAHVEVFAGPEAGFACDNETAVGAVLAGQRQRFLDWDVEPGTPVVYQLVAVSAQGVASEPAAVTITPPAIEQLVRLVVQPQASADLERVERGTRPMLAAAPGHDDAALELSFDVPVAGRYALWIEYGPAHVAQRELALPVRVNDDVAQGTWRLRAPHRLMAPRLGSEPDRAYVDRLALNGRDAFELDAGAATLTLSLNAPEQEHLRHAVGRVWLTNDPAWRPPGFDPRPNFAER